MAKDKPKKHEGTDKPEEVDHDHKPAAEESEDSSPADETTREESETTHEHSPGQNWFARCWHWALGHKLVSIPLAVVLLLGILVAVPWTRFKLASMALKQNFQIVIVDAETQKPVSSALITINGNTAETSGEGLATVRTKVGYTTVDVSKKYYHGAANKTVVPIGKQKSPLKIELKADGRPVPVTVLNSISGKPIADATITVDETQAKTGQEGKTVVVLPADKKDAVATIKADGYNETTATLTVTTDEIETNTFKLTPAGKIYFMSNASGKIDLVKSNLDGTDRQTVLAGTGKEDKYNTVLVASRDWKYIALLSKRDGGEYAKLFLIETGSDKVTVMDEGDASFGLYGWSDDSFVYKVYRQKLNIWQPKREALKSYNAPGKKITTLSETDAVGSHQYDAAYESLTAYILDDEIVYTKNWQSGYYSSALNGKKATFNRIHADGGHKENIKTFNDDTYVETRTGDFGEIKILYEEAGAAKVDVYRHGNLAVGASKSEEFYEEAYPLYSVSPSGKKTLWSDYRDGKNIFFVGDENGENGKEVGRSEDFTIYGWFTDDYILVTRKGSELRIMPSDNTEGIDKAAKISDYYKPDYENRGFGYGYGG
ncbi:MAG TPA: hypothetical protein VFB59_05795 [Candidatus Saccharimonadales bacterium]|nr:hypothetical protein [Candidatus Saccharimonadales bacterium]